MENDDEDDDGEDVVAGRGSQTSRCRVRVREGVMREHTHMFIEFRANKAHTRTRSNEFRGSNAQDINKW